MINNQGYENRLETLNQTNTLQNTINQGLTNNREQATSRFNILSAKIDAQTTLINDKFCQLEMREMQNTINQLRDERSAYQASALTQQQTQNLINQLRPTPVPAYPSCSPYQTYGWGKHFMEVITDVGATMDAATTETPLFNSIKEGGYYGLCF